MSERTLKKPPHVWHKPRVIDAKLNIFEKNYPMNTYDWEMRTKRAYVASEHDNGYTTKANAKRAAKKCAEKFGITITSTEDQT